MKLFAPSWTFDHKLKLNGKQMDFSTEKGFLIFKALFKKSDILEFSFDQRVQALPMANHTYGKGDVVTLNYGALLLGYQTNTNKEIIFDRMPELKRLYDNRWIDIEGGVLLSPVYHLMNPGVNKVSGYAKQVLFNIKSLKK